MNLTVKSVLSAAVVAMTYFFAPPAFADAPVHLVFSGTSCVTTLGSGADDIRIDVFGLRSDGRVYQQTHVLGKINDNPKEAYKEGLNWELMNGETLSPGQTYTVDVVLVGKSRGTLWSKIKDIGKAATTIQNDVWLANAGYPKDMGQAVSNLYGFYFDTDMGQNTRMIRDSSVQFANNSQNVMQHMLGGWKASPITIGSVRVLITRNADGTTVQTLVPSGCVNSRSDDGWPQYNIEADSQTRFNFKDTSDGRPNYVFTLLRIRKP